MIVICSVFDCSDISMFMCWPSYINFSIESETLFWYFIFSILKHYEVVIIKIAAVMICVYIWRQTLGSWSLKVIIG